MGSFFRLADAVNFMTPQELIMILAVVIPLSLSVFFFVFFFVWIVHLMAVHKTVTPPLGYKMK